MSIVINRKPQTTPRVLSGFIESDYPPIPLSEGTPQIEKVQEPGGESPTYRLPMEQVPL